MLFVSLNMKKKCCKILELRKKTQLDGYYVINGERLSSKTKSGKKTMWNKCDKREHFTSIRFVENRWMIKNLNQPSENKNGP